MYKHCNSAVSLLSTLFKHWTPGGNPKHQVRTICIDGSGAHIPWRAFTLYCAWNTITKLSGGDVARTCAELSWMKVWHGGPWQVNSWFHAIWKISWALPWGRPYIRHMRYEALASRLHHLLKLSEDLRPRTSFSASVALCARYMSRSK